MKSTVTFAAFAVLSFAATAQTPETSQPPLPSAVYEWNEMAVQTIPNGVRRYLFDGPTLSLGNIHCHITTLNPGEVSGEPTLHLQEEVLIIKEGRVEVTCDGKLTEAGPGSVIYFAANSVTRLRNIGEGVTTYYVLYHHTPKAQSD